MKYILRGDYPLKSGGKLRQPGDTITLDEDAAAPLLASGRLVPASGATKVTDAEDAGDAGDSGAKEKQDKKGGLFRK